MNVFASLLDRLRRPSVAPATGAMPAPPQLAPVAAEAAPPASPDTSALTARDIGRLAGVHPGLVRVVRRARATTAFLVIEGRRTPERQAQLVAAGASKTLNSRHLTGHAVDLGPVPLDWKDKAGFVALARVVQAAADTEKVPIRWGGTFVGFFDGPHFELTRERYP